MATLADLAQRRRLARLETRRLRRELEHERTHAILAAYGLDYYPGPAHSELPESLVVALQVASELLPPTRTRRGSGA